MGRAVINLAVLIGKKGSVFKSVNYLIEKFSLSINLCAIATYKNYFIAETESQKKVFRRFNYDNPQFFFSEFENLISSYELDKLIIFSWFDRLIPANFIDRGYHIYNQHPSLLPVFPGMNSWDKVWESDLLITGSSIHKVDAGIDTGEIVLQHSMTLNRDICEYRERNRFFLLQVYQAFVFFYLAVHGQEAIVFPKDIFLSHSINSINDIEYILTTVIKA